MFYSKSQAAFVLTCEKLFDTFPKLYFWTFTFKTVMPDWRYSYAWAAFIRDLQNLHGQMILGVKCIEVHPGGHGLHYHAILNVRVNAHIVRRIGKRYGIGRVHVRTCNIGAAYYLVPYLRKEDGLSKGIRRWSTVGGFVGVKKRDIEVDSPYQRNMQRLSGGRKVGFALATTIYRITQTWGDLESWPDSELAKLGVQADWLRSVTRTTKVYALKPDMVYLPKRKRELPSENEVAKLWAEGTRFGRMVICGGKWVDEAKACWTEEQMADIVTARRADSGEIGTEVMDCVPTNWTQ